MLYEVITRCIGHRSIVIGPGKNSQEFIFAYRKDVAKQARCITGYDRYSAAAELPILQSLNTEASVLPA